VDVSNPGETSGLSWTTKSIRSWSNTTCIQS
jgi:hypothetical protein